MYPFERFTARAKRALTLAQQEAELAQHSYIGTEHLLVGLMREADGLAARVLAELGVELDRVRHAIDAALSREERSGPIAQRVPTPRVKRVIEIAFEEARRMGHNYVGTEHLLLGLLIEGEGVAARVLAELGVTLDTARAEIERQLRAWAPEAPGGLPPPRVSGSLREVLSRAGKLAASARAPEIGIDHVEQAIAQWRAEQQ